MRWHHDGPGTVRITERSVDPGIAQQGCTRAISLDDRSLVRRNGDRRAREIDGYPALVQAIPLIQLFHPTRPTIYPNGACRCRNWDAVLPGCLRDAKVCARVKKSIHRQCNRPPLQTRSVLGEHRIIPTPKSRFRDGSGRRSCAEHERQRGGDDPPPCCALHELAGGGHWGMTNASPASDDAWYSGSLITPSNSGSMSSYVAPSSTAAYKMSASSCDIPR